MNTNLLKTATGVERAGAAALLILGKVAALRAGIFLRTLTLEATVLQGEQTEEDHFAKVG